MPASEVRKKRVTLHVRRLISKKRSTPARRSSTEGKPRQSSWLYPSLVLASYLLGALTSYAVLGRNIQRGTTDFPQVAAASKTQPDNDNELDFAALMQQINPPDGYQLSVPYGDLGPRLIEGGAIDFDAFAAVFENAGDALTSSQIEILKQGRDDMIVITPENAHFLLNFFWAVGLANKNTILTTGPMVQYSGGQIENFASTGGWTLGTKPVTEIYGSMELISLTAKQQARVEEVASAVYRPCCNNPTLFPDCNHGMAMLGLLELMASQDASTDEMFKAAKYMNAYWFPQQALEAAIYLKTEQNLDFVQDDGRLMAGRELFSGSGFASLHKTLQANGLLQAMPGSANGCGA